jgi:hypothetical protein
MEDSPGGEGIAFEVTLWLLISREAREMRLFSRDLLSLLIRAFLLLIIPPVN